MRSILAVVFAAILPAAAEASEPPAPNQAPILAMGAYVPTDDMAGSEAFYRALFASAPAIALPDFVAFDVSGGWFAIVSRKRYAPDAQPGSGAVPYLQSADLDTIQTRAAALMDPAPGILVEPGIRLLKLTDPNGQLIEFFQLTGQ